MSRKGYTLFELLAVLTLISIGLMILVGAYSSWGTAHALTGTTRVLEAGLQQARTLARTSNTYIGFKYGPTNGVQTVFGFQIYLCTNDQEIVAAELRSPMTSGTPPTESDVNALLGPDGVVGATPATPYQRITGQITLAYQPENKTAEQMNFAVLFFRPDGSVWSASDTRCHYLCVYSKSLFNKAPLVRILRVDLATGLVTIIKEGGQP